VRVKVLAFIPSFQNEGWGFFMEKLTKSFKHSQRFNMLTFTGIRVLVWFFLLISFNLSLISLSFAESPERIISLAPSMTETLYAAGLGDKIVGVTNYCDYPEEAKKKHKIGGMSNPSIEAVVSLRPDIVVMTTDGNPREFEQRLRSMKIKTYVFKARTTAQLPDGIRQLGMALDETDRFDSLASDIEKALEGFQAQKKENRKKVLFMVWPEPLMVAGPRTAIHDAITLLGAKNIAGDTKMQYPKYSIEEIIRRSPDIIFIGKASGMEDMEKLSGSFLGRISYVPAVKNNKVFYVSDSLYRLGPRVIPGIKELAKYINE
jgi:iron complex transport system substrate-binding protein